MSLRTQHDPKNEAEITYWNSAGGRRWVERQQSQDIVLGPILQATLERAQLRQFFAEPARAFANLRTALKPSGRLAFACWRKFDENPWLQVPLRAALEHVPPLPRPGPEDPGLFSFASEQRVRRILADAGFQSVILKPRDFDLDIACGNGTEEALEAAMALGPTSRALQDQGPETRAAVAMSIRRALQPYQRGKQVALAGAIWLVTANNA